MMQKFIPDELRNFLLCLPSIPYLEAIVLFHRSPSEIWKSKTVARRLYVSESMALRIMSDFCGSGICRRIKGHTDNIIYDPVPESLSNLLSNLVDYYAKNLIEVTNLIHEGNNSQEKAQEFAKAFVWRKEE